MYVLTHRLIATTSMSKSSDAKETHLIGGYRSNLCISHIWAVVIHEELINHGGTCITSLLEILRCDIVEPKKKHERQLGGTVRRRIMLLFNINLSPPLFRRRFPTSCHRTAKRSFCCWVLLDYKQATWFFIYRCLFRIWRGCFAFELDNRCLLGRTLALRSPQCCRPEIHLWLKRCNASPMFIVYYPLFFAGNHVSCNYIRHIIIVFCMQFLKPKSKIHSSGHITGVFHFLSRQIQGSRTSRQFAVFWAPRIWWIRQQRAWEFVRFECRNLVDVEECDRNRERLTSHVNDITELRSDETEQILQYFISNSFIWETY